MSRSPEAQALAERVDRFVDESLSGPTTESFEDLALALHRFQAANDPVIASLVDGPVEHWQDIPAVPVELFKHARVGTCKGDGVVFRTSGTTSGIRGEHWMTATEPGDRASMAWANRCIGRRPPRTRALLLDPADHPDSSLSHMVARMTEGDATWYLGDDGLDLERLERDLWRDDQPCFLPATAFALAEWMERGRTNPVGGVVMVTGGFKGRVHTLDGAALLDTLRKRAPHLRIVTEYGMTELSSQLWGTPDGPFRPPPWLRAVAVDPIGGQPLPSGVPGQLRFVDLCNVDSAVAIETMDEGIVSPSGAVDLFGRLAGAPARGCSLTVEERPGRSA